MVERGDFKQPHVTRALESYARGDVTGSLIRHVVAAELGYESAQSNVAFLLETGRSGAHNFGSAYLCLPPLLAEQVTIGDEDWQRFEAFTQWKRAANQGNVDAQIKTGDYFYYGLGVPVDYRKAVQMYRAAEVENSALALFNLGYMHENGLGIQQDFHLAKRYYDQSLALNAEASLAVSLALLKLNARHFFRWLWYGGSFFLDAPPHEHGRAGAASSPESSASIAPLNDDENAMMDDHVDEDDDHADAHMWHDEEESSETIVILILAFLAGAIMLQRQQPDPRQGEAGNGGVRQNDAPQPEARAAAAERVDNEQDNANDNA